LAVLKLPDGQYNIVEKQHFEQFPVLCRIDIDPLLEKPQERPAETPERFHAPDFFRVDPLPQDETIVPNPLSSSLSSPLSSVATLKPLETPKPLGTAPREPLLKAPHQGFRIACIDDSPTILQTIQAYLDEQFTVVMISDPLKALIQIMRSKPNIILLDVGMPNLDGYELCALLRRHPHFKETPVIMVTGHTGLIDRARAKLVGASGYLTKPFTKPDLIKVVLKHLPPQD
jgi:twitching motility two-component system response regulator PilG